MQYRKSRLRDRLFEILVHTETHPTADWVYKQLKDEIPGLSLGTVYRNLKILIEQGRIQKLPFGSTYDRFDAKTEPHYHFVCENCKEVSDFDMSLYEEINRRAHKDSKFKVLRHRIDFFGICDKCQKLTEQKTKNKGGSNGNKRN